MGDQEVDVLVVGGGIVGAGAALDAVSRGLSVALVEARDWANGTSSRSSKLIHGGLRYLEMLDFRLIGEALRERGLLLQRIAPHLVRPVPFVYPFTKTAWERLYVGTGLLLYDGLGRSRSMPRGVPGHHHLSKRGALAECPSLKPSAISGAVRYYDAQVDDARYTLTVVRTAAALGAWCANRVSMSSYTRDGERVTGAVVMDTETGAEQVVRARQVINATGVWTGDAQTAAGTDKGVHVRASKGVHVLVPRNRLDLASGLILRTEKSVLFVIPWEEQWLIGTTDTEWTLTKAHPAVNSTDVKYLLDRVNRLLVTPLSMNDIVGVYAGLRPLVDCRAQGRGQTAKMSREHVVTRLAPGLVAVAGGKYTTYRVMAADAVDEAVRELAYPVTGSATAELRLLGAEGYHAACNSADRLAAQYGLPVERLRRMLGRYGTLHRSSARTRPRGSPSHGSSPGCRRIPACGNPLCRNTRRCATPRRRADSPHPCVDPH